MQKMYKIKTDVAGTIRKKLRVITSDIKSRYLKKGEYTARYKNKIMIIDYEMERQKVCNYVVYYIRQIERRRKTTTKPEIIVDYKKNMGGVDFLTHK